MSLRLRVRRVAGVVTQHFGKWRNRKTTAEPAEGQVGPVIGRTEREPNESFRFDADVSVRIVGLLQLHQEPDHF